MVPRQLQRIGRGLGHGARVAGRRRRRRRRQEEEVEEEEEEEDVDGDGDGDGDGPSPRRPPPPSSASSLIPLTASEVRKAKRARAAVDARMARLYGTPLEGGSGGGRALGVR